LGEEERRDLALRAKRKGGWWIVNITDILSLLGDPQRALSMFPNPSVWPTLAQDALRGYQVYNIALILGGLLFLLGAASSVIAYQTGRGFKPLLNLLIVSLAGSLFVGEPLSDCMPNTGYPCIVDKRVELVNPATSNISYTVETLNFSSALNQGDTYVLRDDMRQPSSQAMVVALPPYVRYEYGEPLPKLWGQLEGLWHQLAEGSNLALASSLAKYQDQIREQKELLVKLFVVNLGLGAAGLLSDATFTNLVTNLGQRMTSRTVRGAFGVALLGGAGQTLSTGIAILTETIKMVAALLALVPIFIVLSYGFIVSLSGFVFYLVAFLFPLFVGVAAIWGVAAIFAPLRLALVSLLIPTVVSPIVGASLHMIYGYNQSVEEFLSTVDTPEKKTLLDELPMVSDPMASFVASELTRTVAMQLKNTALCLSPYFQRQENGRYVYVQPSQTASPVSYGKCYQNDKVSPTGFSLGGSRPTGADAMSYPIWELRGDLTQFYNDLMSYLNHTPETVGVIDLTSPLKLRALLRLAKTYNIPLSLPEDSNTYAVTLEAHLRDVIARQNLNLTIPQGSVKNALRKLGADINLANVVPDNLKSKFTYSDGGGNQSSLLDGTGGTPSYAWNTVRRVALATEAGISQSELNAAGASQAALSLIVSTAVSMAISLAVIGALWNMSGMVYQATVNGAQGVVEAPGLSHLGGLFRVR
jgi:hypothetical protein